MASSFRSCVRKTDLGNQARTIINLVECRQSWPSYYAVPKEKADSPPRTAVGSLSHPQRGQSWWALASSRDHGGQLEHFVWS